MRWGRLQLLLTPEVQRLMYRQIAKGMGMAVENLQTQRRQSYATPQGKHQLLKDVVAWLVINSMRSEKVQFNLLCEQNASNVWRKHAYSLLLGNRDSVGTQECAAEVRDAVNVFRQKVHFDGEGVLH